jgi:hypothetical protein
MALSTPECCTRMLAMLMMSIDAAMHAYIHAYIQRVFKSIRVESTRMLVQLLVRGTEVSWSRLFHRLCSFGRSNPHATSWLMFYFHPPCHQAASTFRCSLSSAALTTTSCAINHDALQSLYTLSLSHLYTLVSCSRWILQLCNPKVAFLYIFYIA